MHLGHQDEKHTMKGLLKLFFMLAVDLAGLILECFPLSVGCESRAPGKALGGTLSGTQVCVFLLIRISHISCSSAKRQKVPWHARDWETEGEMLGTSSTGALWQTSSSLTWLSCGCHLHRKSFCPCSGLNSSLKKHRLHHPAAAKAPVSTWSVFLSFRRIFAFCLLPLIKIT